ncbi:hypothetical protein NQ315_011885 [Exocentrus adspersus]|uniref:cystathionine gamma-lyase n=1 Tax=Exocentrus adspersus TaxID=1586481 RepID=A0AAV8W170_9CUCU|nr:hypothetical protein NQ315_011885 [Exocentrus adspersus]
MGEREGYLPFPKGFSTAAIHHSQEPEQWDSMAVVTPLVTSTTYKQHGPAEFKKYEYSRSGNPTREVLENVLAELDHGKYGLTFSSGLGATTTLFGLLNKGDNVVVGDDVYGGTNRLFNKVGTRFGLEFTLVDLTVIESLEKAIKPNTKLVWVETPTNPTLKVVDIKAVSEITRKKNIILIVDNTFITSYLQRPLDFGADAVLYSLTKYMNGHSDVIMGAITTSNKELYDKLKFLQNAMGIVPAPFDCYQVLRSLKTLSLRMERHHENSLVIAKYLETHPKVEKVLHPCLSSHLQYELTKKQTSGHSGVFSFYVKGGLEQSKTFLKALKIFTLAESLGGYESLIELPCVMTHASVPPELRKTLGISDNLIRLSVGIEDVEDLLADLKQAFNQKMGEELGYLPYPEGFETACVHHTRNVEELMDEKISVPIVNTNFYRHSEKGKLSKFAPGRVGNTTRSILENLLTVLHRSKYGLCFSSGIGAVWAVVALLKSGDHVICTDDVYGGTTKLLVEVAPKFGICATHIDLTKLNNLESAIRPQTKLIWTEVPSNPLLKVVDLCGLAEIAKEHDLILATDNSFMSPYLQNPLALGADLSVLSLSKYTNGHSDVIMGSVCTNRKDLYKKLKYIQTNFGHVACPFDCYQVIRGAKTLPIRMKRHQYNSLEIAKFLENHPKVEAVQHPGLKSHPQHELFKKQSCGNAGMLSFYIKGKVDDTLKLVNGLKYFTHAVSLGGYEGLVSMPCLSSHVNVSPEMKKTLGYTENLVRMSVGIENICDLISDLDHTLNSL